MSRWRAIGNTDLPVVSRYIQCATDTNSVSMFSDEARFPMTQIDWQAVLEILSSSSSSLFGGAHMTINCTLVSLMTCVNRHGYHSIYVQMVKLISEFHYRFIWRPFAHYFEIIQEL